MQHFVRTFLLHKILDLAETLGAARTGILQEIEVDEHTACQSGAWMESSKLIDAIAFASEVTNRKDFGLTLGMNNDHRTLGSLGIFAEHCRSVSEAVAEGSRFMRLHNSALRYSVVPGPAGYRMRVQVLAQGKYPQQQYIEALLAMQMGFWRLLMGPQWCPTTVMFEHENPGPRESYRRAFGCPVKFGRDMNCLVASKEDFERRITAHDSRIKSVTGQMLDELDRMHHMDLPRQVRILLLPLIPAGRATAGHVSRHLSMAPRTLQRSLAESGTTFKTLVTEARLQLARDYAKDESMTVTRLASILGFSEVSAVSRFLRQNMSEHELKTQSRRKSNLQ